MDDESAVRNSFIDYFEDKLWRTIAAENAEEALELLKSESPDAAVVDVRLPGMDGNEFIRVACQEGRNIAFVLCTGSPEYVVPMDLQEFTCVSARLFKKPVTNLAKMEEEIRHLINQIKMETENV